MICNNCGHENVAGARFCTRCGQPLSQPAKQVAPPPPTPPRAEPVQPPKESVPPRPEPAGGAPKPPKTKTGLSRKNKNILLGAAIALAVVVLIIAGVGIFKAVNHKGDDPLAVGDLEEALPYVVLQSEPVYTDYEDLSESGLVLEPGTTITITSIFQDDQGQLWGMMEDATYLLLEDGFNTRAVRIRDDYTASKAEMNYNVVETTKVYAMPNQDYPAIGELTSAQSPVFVLETVNVGDCIYGRFAENQWALLKDAEKTYVADANSKTPTAPKPAKSKEIIVEKLDGYTPGNYKLSAESKVRKSASYKGTVIETLKKGETVKIARFQKVANKNSYWGELDKARSGHWILIKDDDGTYLSKE